eukprot:TRINITY_DN22834_c0_g1_i1.p1 TRINITY_DN22834_c0_g1~~TRINITY_DN22834_c0_g1_i1.p1  ORF type:complete len:571 (-),score=91.88 TRINITY_DN22834_c0_g1_i1:30-1742(-)
MAAAAKPRPPSQGSWMRSAVGFGGYPEFQDRRLQYEAEERCDVVVDRQKFTVDLEQLKLLHRVVVDLQRGDFSTPSAPSSPARSHEVCPSSDIRRLSCREMKAELSAHGWQGFTRPILFELPSSGGDTGLASREALLAAAASRDFETATVLSDPLAAQFGPAMLGEDTSIGKNRDRNCFTQLAAAALASGSIPRRCWDSIPEWMRLSMLVISTGPGGNGVGFHKHGIAWLGLHEGTKRWWIYPPDGPPTQEAYDALALCPAWRLPEAVAMLPVKTRPLEVLQRAGEGLFVPGLWWHATLDGPGATLGIGSQRSMAELDVLEDHRQHPESAFAQYHAACELHKTNEEEAMALFEGAIAREPLNFYFMTNQLRFYLNMVFHPRLTCSIIERLMHRVRKLDPARQMIVQRFAVPSIVNFAEWHSPHDRLLKFSLRAVSFAWGAMLELARPFLPGGDKLRLTTSLPWELLAWLKYEACCSQCGCFALGQAGEPGSIRAHRFFCSTCKEARQAAVCGSCAQQGGPGQMGLTGSDFAQTWYCQMCWAAWSSRSKGTGRGFSQNTDRSLPLTWDIVD